MLVSKVPTRANNRPNKAGPVLRVSAEELLSAIERCFTAPEIPYKVSQLELVFKLG